METTGKKFGKKEALLDWWNKSLIQGFGNTYDIRVIAKLDGMTYWTKSSKRPRSMRKNNIGKAKPDSTAW